MQTTRVSKDEILLLPGAGAACSPGSTGHSCEEPMEDLTESSGAIRGDFTDAPLSGSGGRTASFAEFAA